MAYTSTGFNNPFGFTITPWVKRLLIANGVVFLLTVALVGIVPYLVFTPAQILLQPWTLPTVVTYMFVHIGFFHLFFNMLVLFFFGPPLEERWGSQEFLKFYLICGIGGALLSVLFPYQPIAGASAAIYGLMVAFALYWPDNPIYIWGIFPVKAKWLVTGLIGLSIFFMLTGGATGIAHLAHLGGAAAAFLYLRSSWGPSAFGPRPKKPSRRRFRVESQPAEPATAGWQSTPEPRPAPRTAREEAQVLDELDRILDKISKEGIESLSAREKRYLDEASRRYRTN